MATVGGNPRSLRVYALAADLSGRMARIARFARCSVSLKDQLCRASESIVLNIAEGAGHLTPRQKLNAFRIAHGSARECTAALDMIARQDGRADLRRARSDVEMVARMLARLIETTEAAARAHPRP